jgi:DNA-directed RNA polymerase specialized sigma24 family protein
VQFINDFRHVRAAQLKRSSSHPEECLKQKLYESYFCFVFLARVDEAFAETDESADLWERRQQALDECVAALPEKSRRLLSLRYEGRESVENVAGRVGQSFDAVTKALYRLRQALSDCIERKLSHP